MAVSSLKIIMGGSLCFPFLCFDYEAHFRSFTIKPAHTPANPIEDELLWNIVLNGLCRDEGFGYEYLMIDNFYPNLRQARGAERWITAHFLPFPIECE